MQIKSFIFMVPLENEERQTPTSGTKNFKEKNSKNSDIFH